MVDVRRRVARAEVGHNTTTARAGIRFREHDGASGAATAPGSGRPVGADTALVDGYIAALRGAPGLHRQDPPVPRLARRRRPRRGPAHQRRRPRLGRARLPHPSSDSPQAQPCDRQQRARPPSTTSTSAAASDPRAPPEWRSPPRRRARSTNAPSSATSAPPKPAPRRAIRRSRSSVLRPISGPIAPFGLMLAVPRSNARHERRHLVVRTDSEIWVVSGESIHREPRDGSR
jgi:hypothetical protein